MSADRLKPLIRQVRSADADAEREARAYLDSLAKPPGSLGGLEDLAARLSAIAGFPPAPLERACVLVFGADHGVAARGVSAYPAEVTGLILRAVAEGRAAVSVLARAIGAEVVAVDMGTRVPVEAAGVLPVRIAAGSADLSTGPALTEDQALRAIEAGFEIGARLARRNDVVGLGEVGIGNTTVAAALAVALAGVPVERAVGRGTGITSFALAEKRKIVATAAARVGSTDPVGALREVGGLEVAGLSGAALGAAAMGRPVVLDGYISSVAGLVAARLAPAVGAYLFASHRSAEAGHRDVLAALGLHAALDLGMRLGEGTGAVLAFPILRAAAALLREMATLEAVVGAPARSAHGARKG
ncbi:MAG TPA: nicotinate-nucleotide--dimethylbenzimidazole phosphoribosyltransferase [Gemmatimonadota bacterium]|nr:nicotinate-nucleotide--dimethylbenzimidazole phosphoribosyltransferase [Gemmatimonadota bacterium]